MVGTRVGEVVGVMVVKGVISGRLVNIRFSSLGGESGAKTEGKGEAGMIEVGEIIEVVGKSEGAVEGEGEGAATF
ncbi:hypothetical protein A2781_02545 [Candidatus Gottesmanbacteria bacterium RIFCSPHIGHO2_01_FULL_42_27]|uniref:Uncharacterized protein n=1 Tax=Candidatus Gottesmanbacteria bacterium RIFCSPLOWO2_01_FULL_42_22 TaxID=1798391 RepID=A0A1F6BII1_9BACT|nr:MAG: hypothetical protein A2781_02545 [Candidatus Gottesmanbacteria bacterium RIFCSPHIGHO2_01_FULL_42_27]OGG36746.1 MAG: hypothetical protein A2968_03865 [Candidatus Gottesmanbacteria bacterium RIFCSPLOWO2_01_FULL_42_22]